MCGVRKKHTTCKRYFGSYKNYIFVISGTGWDMFGDTLGVAWDGFGMIWGKCSDFVLKTKIPEMSRDFVL